VNATCRYHCSVATGGCGACFRSLRAWDSHRVGPWEDRRCDLTVDGLVEIPGGICRISGPTGPKLAVTVYGHESAERVRSYFEGVKGRHSASGNGKSRVAG
jgi:hypothetical protein